MQKNYDYTTREPVIYELWQERGAFAPQSDQRATDFAGSTDSANSTSSTNSTNQTNHPTPTNNSFCIIMPPPNANDPLHIGHAMFVALEDTLVRFHRMKGDNTVWIPGTDHAGIETQYVFEKKLQKQKKSRFDFDRETLYQQIWDYVQENSGVATQQIKTIGASADWSRFKFTLDDDVVDFVLNTFERMHDDNLVYRDLQLVNYCTKCGTGFSELEINHDEQKTTLYYIKYFTSADKTDHISIATTRPELIFADTHLAINPKDGKNKHHIGTTVLNPLTSASMQIIADEFVDPDFGTGIVKLTPAHDANDFAAGKRHNLPLVEGIDRRGKITTAGGKYAGLSVVQAREAVVADLTASDHMLKQDTNHHNRSNTCYRCSRTIEPLPLAQFFIQVNNPKNSLTASALKALDSKQTIIHGAGQEKILRHWLENLRDWNISRQITWGIRIPVWYEVAGHEDDIFVSFVSASGQHKHGKLSELLGDHPLDEIQNNLQQVAAGIAVPYSISRTKPTGGAWLPETDTFDTWFSSAQWPVVTLKTHEDDFERFYPTSVMETGYDILPFWVMRMMLMGIYLTGTTPFNEVYLHGLVRDQKGQKMSKSKGNTINPLEIVEAYGADALRMALIIRSTAAQDKNVGEPDFKAMRNFTNKIWNASRFVILKLGCCEHRPNGLLYTETSGNYKNLDDFGQNDKINSAHMKADASIIKDQNISKKNKAFTKKLNAVSAAVTQQLNDRKIGLAAETVYNEFWHWFCDECIEDSKTGELSQEDVLLGLTTFLTLLHPFVPFVTEAVWQELKQHNLVHNELLITTPWPQQPEQYE